MHKSQGSAMQNKIKSPSLNKGREGTSHSPASSWERSPVKLPTTTSFLPVRRSLTPSSRLSSRPPFSVFVVARLQPAFGTGQVADRLNDGAFGSVILARRLARNKSDRSPVKKEVYLGPEELSEGMMNKDWALRFLVVRWRTGGSLETSLNCTMSGEVGVDVSVTRSYPTLPSVQRWCRDSGKDGDTWEMSIHQNLDDQKSSCR